MDISDDDCCLNAYDHARKEYALYKGDELLGMGTVKELARQFNVKIETIHYYNTPTIRDGRTQTEQDDLYRWIRMMEIWI